MKKYIKTDITEIQQIPDYFYFGYYWKSDQDKPVTLKGQSFPKDEILEKNNPFIVEALLYSTEHGISIHIQHTGDYMVTAFDHKALEGYETIEKHYIPHKLEGVKKVVFKQVWEEVLQVDNEISFPTLKPSAIIFSGFNY